MCLSLRRGALWAAVGVCALALPARGLAQTRKQIPFSDEAVEKAIEKAKARLWSLYRPRGAPWPERGPRREQGRVIQDVNYGGQSALVMFALLAAGEKPAETRMKRALDWLADIDSKGTYTLGIRMQVWTYLQRKLHRPLLKKDAQRLLKSIQRPPRRRARGSKWSHSWGTYSYTSADKPSEHADSSNTHIGILGVWAAARMNIEVPKGYWRLVFQHYVRSQSADGTWRYGVGPGPVPRPGQGYGQYPPGGMTAAGLANLLVAWENVHAGDFVRCGKNPDLTEITKALKWLDKNLGKYANGYHYYLYALERVSLATGYKFFGTKDWYKLSATRLLNTQRADGSWARAGFGDSNDLVATAFALIFLARGRNPVIFNRLRYEGDWNNRPRALACLTRWISREFEGEINWQIVNLQSRVDQWHDAPILLITGAKPPKFSDEQLDKLRRFVHQGGLLLTIGECGGRFFDAAWRGQRAQPGIYQRLFPHYELKQLPADHPIYGAHFKTRPTRMWGVSNGIRLLALHTTVDLPLAWQTNAYATNADAFRLPFNIAHFVMDRASLRHRGTSPWPPPARAAAAPARRIKVARIKYGGNWDPEPLAWERFGLLMAGHWKTGVAAEPVECKALDAGRHRVAHMTGTTAVTLSEAEKKAFRAYVQAGGTVIVDSAGGSEAFAQSAVALVRELFGEGSLRKLPSFSPVYRLGGMEIDSVAYRRAARQRVGADRRPRLMGVTAGGRTAVLLSPEDLTSGLAGYPCATCVGYAPGTVKKPGSAVKLMRNMVLYAHQARKPATAPATKPAAK